MKKILLLTIFLSIFLFADNNLIAQITTTGQAVQTESYDFQLFPNNGSETLSIPFQVQSEGKLTGTVMCKTEGFIPVDMEHLNFILFQKDAQNSLTSLGGKSFQKDAAISFLVTNEQLAKGKEFVFTTRSIQSKVKCQCTLEIRFVGSMAIEHTNSSGE